MLKWSIFGVKWRVYGYEWQSFFGCSHTTRADMYPAGCQSVGACLPVVIIIGDVWGGGDWIDVLVFGAQKDVVVPRGSISYQIDRLKSEFGTM